MRHMCSKFTPYTCITVDMLFNIVGHKIDGNCESWNCLMQKLAPSRGPSFPHPGAIRVMLKECTYCFHISYVHTKLLTH